MNKIQYDCHPELVSGSRQIRNKIYGRVTRQSSALIFTLLIVGMVSSLTFFVGRSAVKEVKIVNADQNSLGAYYAAEAGLEDGLARLSRFSGDPNIEVPTCAFNKPHVPLPSPPNPLTTALDPCDDKSDGANFNSNLSIADLGEAKPLSFASRTRIATIDSDGKSGEKINVVSNQTDGKNNNKNLDPNIALKPNDYVYDLKITSRTKFFGAINDMSDGVVDGSGEPSDPTNVVSALIAKDSYRDFTLYESGNNVADEIHFWWECQNNPCNTVTKFLQFTLYRPNPLGGAETTTDIIRRDNPDSGHSNTTIQFKPTSLGAVSKVRVKTINDGAFLSVAFYRTSAPDGYVYFKGDKARLQSIGYHAGIKRRLEADIDRRTGGLLSLFDYAVYGGTGILQPN